jgi:hypothetical protein
MRTLHEIAGGQVDQMEPAGHGDHFHRQLLFGLARSDADLICLVIASGT